MRTSGNPAVFSVGLLSLSAFTMTQCLGGWQSYKDKMKIKYLKTEALKQKLEELRTPQAKTETRPAKGDESSSLYARHIAEELARRNK